MKTKSPGFADIAISTLEENQKERKKKKSQHFLSFFPVYATSEAHLYLQQLFSVTISNKPDEHYAQKFHFKLL